MATRNQKGWVGRLDALAARTNRSRGAYLRMALWAALSSLERMHWEQVAADTTGVTVTKTATFIRQRPPKPNSTSQHNTKRPTQGAFFMPWSGCADVPIQHFWLRRCSHTVAQMFPYSCADVPIQAQLSTGAELGFYLFPLVAYNYKL